MFNFENCPRFLLMSPNLDIFSYFYVPFPLPPTCVLRHGRDPCMSDSRGHVAPNPTSGPEPPAWPSTVRRELQPLLEARGHGPDGWISDNLQFQRPKAIYLMVLNGKDHEIFVIYFINNSRGLLF